MNYDDLNRLSTKRRDSAGGSLLVEYFYDAIGYLGMPSKSKAYTTQGVVEVRTPAYDARGRVFQQEWIVPGTGGGISYLSAASYNALGQAVELRLDQGGNGLTRKYDYNPGTLRLDALKAGKYAPFEDIQKLNYSYDNVGRAVDQRRRQQQPGAILWL